MTLQDTYDVGIIGGGVAGLSMAIQMSVMGYSVVLFEKEQYPFHKVCGEYVSMESWDFLKGLGLLLDDLGLPRINTLLLTAPGGKSFKTRLPLGGFGISRYMLDDSLAAIARKNGVHLMEGNRADQVEFDGEFLIKVHSKTGAASVRTKLCFASYGKRGNIDVKWKRSFLDKQDRRLNNYIGVKYHIRTDWPESMIGLHNFKNGYCGISRVEGDKYCLCYMAHADNLKTTGNDVRKMEKEFLMRNPYLKEVFSSSEILDEFPVTISQINFSKKTQVENHVIFLGDAAGTIPPLCGNGMSMAMHSSKIAAALAGSFSSGRISREQMENAFTEEWNSQFRKRMAAGRTIQQFFGSETLSNLFVGAFKIMPFLAGPVIRLTHGRPF